MSHLDVLGQSRGATTDAFNLEPSGAVNMTLGKR